MPRNVVGIFSHAGLVVDEIKEREEDYGTFLNTCIALVCWRAGTHSALEGFVWCREWERMTLVSGMWVCFFDEISPKSSYALNRVAAQFIRAHLLQSFPASVWKMDCPCPPLLPE